MLYSEVRAPSVQSQSFVGQPIPAQPSTTINDLQLNNTAPRREYIGNPDIPHPSYAASLTERPRISEAAENVLRRMKLNCKP
jgi:hypothetical protein